MLLMFVLDNGCHKHLDTGGREGDQGVDIGRGDLFSDGKGLRIMYATGSVVPFTKSMNNKSVISFSNSDPLQETYS